MLRPFSLWMGFEPLSEASLRALSLQVCFLVVLSEAESLRLSLAFSSVLPWWPCGVVVACLLHTQEVPGSIPGRGSYLRQVSLH